MKSALQIVAYSNSSETEGTIALLEVAIAALLRTGFSHCADLAGEALHAFIEASHERLAHETRPVPVTAH